MKLSDRNIITEALRANGYRQITGRLADGKGGVCARGCIAEAFGVAPCSYDVVVLEERLGLLADHGRYAGHIEAFNDSGFRFSYIADWIEANVPVDEIVEIEEYANIHTLSMA